jgi:hypothetical protein
VGHQDVDRPSRIYDRLTKKEEIVGDQSISEGIDVAEDTRKRKEDAPSHLTPIAEGLALRVVSHGEECLSDD